jgi:hypothetical protein
MTLAAARVRQHWQRRERSYAGRYRNERDGAGSGVRDWQQQVHPPPPPSPPIHPPRPSRTRRCRRRRSMRRRASRRRRERTVAHNPHNGCCSHTQMGGGGGGEWHAPDGKPNAFCVLPPPPLPIPTQRPHSQCGGGVPADGGGNVPTRSGAAAAPAHPRRHGMCGAAVDVPARPQPASHSPPSGGVSAERGSPVTSRNNAPPPPACGCERGFRPPPLPPLVDLTHPLVANAGVARIGARDRPTRLAAACQRMAAGTCLAAPWQGGPRLQLCKRGGGGRSCPAPSKLGMCANEPLSAAAPSPLTCRGRGCGRLLRLGPRAQHSSEGGSGRGGQHDRAPRGGRGRRRGCHLSQGRGGGGSDGRGRRRGCHLSQEAKIRELHRRSTETKAHCEQCEA